MPTGRITFPGGLSSQAIQTPIVPSNPRGVRDGNNGNAWWNGGGGTAPAHPVAIPSYGAEQTPFYAKIVPEIAKANYVTPSNQGHRMMRMLSGQMENVMMVNSPSRSLFSEGYTAAIQVFAASNTWQLAGPVDSPGKRALQPNSKFVSPFSNLPIPVAMPWDL